MSRLHRLNDTEFDRFRGYTHSQGAPALAAKSAEKEEKEEVPATNAEVLEEIGKILPVTKPKPSGSQPLKIPVKKGRGIRILD